MGDGLVQRDQGWAVVIGGPPFAIGDDGAGRRRGGIGDAAVAIQRPFGVRRDLDVSRWAKASRTSGDFGRGMFRMARRRPSASRRSNTKAAIAPTKNSAANTGEGATIKVRAATPAAAPAEIAR